MTSSPWPMQVGPLTLRDAREDDLDGAPDGMGREQHGIEDSWHAELGWVDGYTYAILAREWEARRSAADPG